MAELTYLQAISDGLRTEMRRDRRVFLIGDDAHGIMDIAELRFGA